MVDSVSNRFIQQAINAAANVIIHTTDGRKITCQIDEFDEVAILAKIFDRSCTDSILFDRHAISSITLLSEYF